MAWLLSPALKFMAPLPVVVIPIRLRQFHGLHAFYHQPCTSVHKAVTNPVGHSSEDSAEHSSPSFRQRRQRLGQVVASLIE